jgi:hypothetical protein
VRYESTTSYIASTLLMDAYPPGAHCRSREPPLLPLANSGSV